MRPASRAILVLIALLLLTTIACQMAAVAPEPTETPAPTGTSSPVPTGTSTHTPEPTQTLTLAPTRTPRPTSTRTTRPSPTVDIAKKIDNARILAYEDVAGMYGILDRKVEYTLQQLFPSRNVTYVADRQGEFFDHLKSDTAWDLIIVSAESRTGIRGEFWDLIYDQVINRKAGLIVEMWYLDEIHTGSIAPLLDACGIEFDKDWQRASADAITRIEIFEPEHPLASFPFVVEPVLEPRLYWPGNAGDFIRLAPDSDAVLLAGGGAGVHTRAVLASCLDGRMVFQTFSSHDYRKDMIEPLWGNYVINALFSHFVELYGVPAEVLPGVQG